MKRFLALLSIFLIFMTVCYAAPVNNNGNSKMIVIKNPSYVQRAISSGDAASLKTLMRADNINPNDIVYEALGYNLLAYSMLVKKPRAEIVDILIKAGADVNAPTKNNAMTPLHLISMRDDLNDPADIFNLLIKAGANVNYADAQHRYVIVRSVMNGHVECVRLLIKEGALVNVKNSQGYSLIKIATMKKIDTKDPKYDEIIAILKRAGAQP